MGKMYRDKELNAAVPLTDQAGNREHGYTKLAVFFPSVVTQPSAVLNAPTRGWMTRLCCLGMNQLKYYTPDSVTANSNPYQFGGPLV